MRTAQSVIAMVAGLLVATLAPARTIVLLQPPNQGGYSISDPGFGRAMAEDFTLERDSLIREVVLFGVRSDPTLGDSFTVVFHEDNGGVPGRIENVAWDLAPSPRSATGQLVGTQTEFVYYLLLPAPVPLESGTWWVEVFNASPGPISWGWEGGDSDPVHGIEGCASAEEVPGTDWTPRNYSLSILVVGSPVPIFSDGFESGDTDAWSQTIPPIGRPQADFTFMVTGLQVQFHNMTTGDMPLTYLWDFGDGSMPPYRFETNPVHNYSTAGTYTVRLTATNSLGTDSIPKSVIVSP